MHASQISAYISAETKRRLELYAKKHGVKKAHLVETALSQHLSALEAIPTRFIIPARLQVTKASGERIVKLIDDPGQPTEAMRALFADGD
jgi:hypothetical protein